MDDDAQGELDDPFRKDINVSEDFPGRVMKARNYLRKFLRDALKNNKKAYLNYDKLIIEGEAYEYDSTLEDIVAVGK